MVASVNMAYVIGSILQLVIKQLELPIISIIVYTNLYLLYKCLVKLGTITEKRLMIDIIAI